MTPSTSTTSISVVEITYEETPHPPAWYKVHVNEQPSCTENFSCNDIVSGPLLDENGYCAGISREKGSVIPHCVTESLLNRAYDGLRAISTPAALHPMQALMV